MKAMQKDLVSKLGTMTDSHIAQLFKLPVYHVRKLRLEKNIPKYRGHRTEFAGAMAKREVAEMVAQFGQESDATLAMCYGISRERIRQLRKELNIGVNPFGHLKLTRVQGEQIVKDLPNLSNDAIIKKHQIPPTTIRSLRVKFDIPERDSAIDVEKQLVLQRLIPELGKASDYTLARKFGIHHAVVRYNRITRGISPFKPRWQKKLTAQKEKFLKKDLMKDMPTDDVSKKYGICKALVYQYRVKFDIPANKFRKLTAEQHDEFIKDLGTMTDTDVAKKHGLSSSYVYATRLKHKIHAFKKKVA